MSDVSVPGQQLRAFVERIERLAEERKTIADDIAEVLAEAAGTGFNKRHIKQVIKIRAAGIEAYLDQDAELTLYLQALGMIPDEASHVQVQARVENIEKSAAVVGVGCTSAGNVSGEISAFISNSLPSPSTEAKTGEAVSPPASPVTVSVLHSPEVAGGRPSPSSDEAPAGQHGMFGQSEHQTASAAQGRNEPASASGASATKSAMTAKTQAELIRLLRPNCRHADDLEKCGGQGSKHCNACKSLAPVTHEASL